MTEGGNVSKPDLDRCEGVLLGLAAGDALGAGYEFRAPPTGDAEMKGGGLGGWAPGEWTDDTQMAICIAEETATGSPDLEAIAAGFLEWYRSGPADVGIQTRSVLSGAAKPSDVASRAAAHFKAHPDRSAGNGSLMRTAPVALAALGDDDRLVDLAMAVSGLTHADPLAGEACALWCIAIDRAISMGRPDGIRDGIELLPPDRRSFWSERIAEVEKGPMSRFSPNGYVVSALQAALSAIWHTPVPPTQPCRHLQHALHAAVRIGDDTDTVAAIAGGLLGATWGASAVPVAWRAILHGKPGTYRQPDYSSTDLVRLAALSAGRGHPDPIGWPEKDDLRSYYGRWPARITKPLEEDDGVLLANFWGAMETSADVTISLCRMGRHQLEPATHPVRVELGLLDSAKPADNRNTEFVLEDLANAISRWRDAGKTVVVHCVQAENRTPAVAAAYLAQRFAMSGSEALRKIYAQLQRPAAHANPAFETALQAVWPSAR